MELDPNMALGLLKQGATILLLDVPQLTFLGIDTQAYTVGPVFKGIKMIPPGPHFIYYSSSSKDGLNFSPVTGFFVDATPSEIIVRKWDMQEERLVRVGEEEENRYRQAVRGFEFDRHLGPYNLNGYGEWKRLSNYLTRNIIERIEPIGGDITVTVEADNIGSSSKSFMERILDEQLRKSGTSAIASKFKQKKACNYTCIPRLIRNKDVNAEGLTAMNLDKSTLLESVLTKDFNGAEDSLLGELQFAFIAFLMGQSLEAFYQWKSLVSLLLGCTEAPFHTRTELFTKFIKVIYFQLKFGLHNESAAGCNESWLSGDSFLYQNCKEFILMVAESSAVDGDLLSWTRRLRNLLERSLGWKLQQNYALSSFEDDEYAPVVQNIEDEA